MSVNVDADNGEVRATRTVRQSGNSTVVVIPPEMLGAVGFELGDDIDLVAGLESKEIVLRAASEGQPTDES